MRDGYVARWRGREYQASPDGDDIRLYQPEPGEGFEEVRPGRMSARPPTGGRTGVHPDHLHLVGQLFIVLAGDGWLRWRHWRTLAGGLSMGLRSRLRVYRAGRRRASDLREHRVERSDRRPASGQDFAQRSTSPGTVGRSTRKRSTLSAAATHGATRTLEPWAVRGSEAVSRAPCSWRVGVTSGFCINRTNR
jgi:hypothetical protein